MPNVFVFRLSSVSHLLAFLDAHCFSSILRAISLPSVFGGRRHTRAADRSHTVARFDIDRRIRRAAVGFGRAHCRRRSHLLVWV